MVLFYSTTLIPVIHWGGDRQAKPSRFGPALLSPVRDTGFQNVFPERTTSTLYPYLGRNIGNIILRTHLGVWFPVMYSIQIFFRIIPGTRRPDPGSVLGDGKGEYCMLFRPPMQKGQDKAFLPGPAVASFVLQLGFQKIC